MVRRQLRRLLEEPAGPPVPTAPPRVPAQAPKAAPTPPPAPAQTHAAPSDKPRPRANSGTAHADTDGDTWADRVRRGASGPTTRVLTGIEPAEWPSKTVFRSGRAVAAAIADGEHPSSAVIAAATHAEALELSDRVRAHDLVVDWLILRPIVGGRTPADSAEDIVKCWSRLAGGTPGVHSWAAIRVGESPPLPVRPDPVSAPAAGPKPIPVRLTAPAQYRRLFVDVADSPDAVAAETGG